MEPPWIETISASSGSRQFHQSQHKHGLKCQIRQWQSYWQYYGWASQTNMRLNANRSVHACNLPCSACHVVFVVLLKTPPLESSVVFFQGMAVTRYQYFIFAFQQSVRRCQTHSLRGFVLIIRAITAIPLERYA